MRLRFPRTVPAVVIDTLERLYLGCFPLLQLFVTVFPLLSNRRADADAAVPEHAENPASEQTALEFLPLMLTSVYCAIGLVWAFIRLSVIYLVRVD